MNPLRTFLHNAIRLLTSFKWFCIYQKINIYFYQIQNDTDGFNYEFLDNLLFQYTVLKKQICFFQVMGDQRSVFYQ